MTKFERVATIISATGHVIFLPALIAVSIILHTLVAIKEQVLPDTIEAAALDIVKIKRSFNRALS